MTSSAKIDRPVLYKAMSMSFCELQDSQNSLWTIKWSIPKCSVKPCKITPHKPINSVNHPALRLDWLRTATHTYNVREWQQLSLVLFHNISKLSLLPPPLSRYSRAASSKQIPELKLETTVWAWWNARKIKFQQHLVSVLCVYRRGQNCSTCK